MKAIKLMPDYNTFPLWHYEGEEVGAIDPIQLPLTGHLPERLTRWAKWYDTTLNQEYPPDSGFRSVGELIAFDKEGVLLWRDLRLALAKEYKVVFYSLLLAKVLTQPEQAKARNHYKVLPEFQHLLAPGQK